MAAEHPRIGRSAAHVFPLRTWRRSIEKALTGRVRTRPTRPQGVAGPQVIAVEPAVVGTDLRRDTSPWHLEGIPRQGRLGDCWLIAPMLALAVTRRQCLADLLTVEADGIIAVHFPGADAPLRVDRDMPVDAQGAFSGARVSAGAPGWVGVLEKAAAAQIAGGYRMLQRGFACFGFALLLGTPTRTRLRLPSPAQAQQWAAEGRAMAVSTHPLSGLVRHGERRIAPNHVYALVGGDPQAGTLLLRNPVDPTTVLELDRRTFRLGFLAVDVTQPLGS